MRGFGERDAVFGGVRRGTPRRYRGRAGSPEMGGEGGGDAYRVMGRDLREDRIKEP